MKINKLLESAAYDVKTVPLQSVEVSEIVDLINDGGQLSWVLTPQRLAGKLGSTGMLFGLYYDNEPVGVIAIKEMHIEGIHGGEIGYLYVHPDHRSLPNAIKLYNAALDNAKRYGFLMASTITTNREVNTLLKRSSRVELLFSAKSPYSSNILNYWMATASGGSLTFEELKDIMKDHFGYIAESTNVDVSISLNGLDKVPAAFKSNVEALTRRSSMIKIDNDSSLVQVYFGRRSGLPSTPNTVFVGNKYMDKTQQHNMVKNVVPTVATFTDSSQIEGDFIAKRVNGYKQQGQMINQIPDDPENYIFQPLLDIVAEYRVVVYYMNGQYHVSGVYEKTGSNMSFRSLSSGGIWQVASRMSVLATQKIGYGFSGVDIALVKASPHITESSITGKLASKLGSLGGNVLSQKEVGGGQQLVFLEANTLPSMSNPMIMNDAMTHMIKNAKR